MVERAYASAFDEVTAPERSTMVYSFPAKGKRKALQVIWQDGIKNAPAQTDFMRPPGLPDDLNLDAAGGCGQAFVGTEGVIYLNDPYGSGAPQLFRKGKAVTPELVAPVYARVKGGPTQELCRAIRGEGPRPISNFEDHAGPLTEMVLAGNLALRLGQKIDWDAAKLEARGMPEVQKFIRRAYRAGWEPKIS